MYYLLPKALHFYDQKKYLFVIKICIFLFTNSGQIYVKVIRRIEENYLLQLKVNFIDYGRSLNPKIANLEKRLYLTTNFNSKICEQFYFGMNLLHQKFSGTKL